MRQATPTSSSEIMNRINEITFNSSLIGEYRAIDFVARLIDQGKLPRGTGPGQYRRINIHRILLDRFGTHFDAVSRLSTDYDFFDMLHVSGKRAARRFLDEHFDDIGVKSTVDLPAEAQAEWARQAPGDAKSATPKFRSASSKRFRGMQMLQGCNAAFWFL